MVIESSYPKHLLTASDEDRLRYFKCDVIVDHPILEKIVSDLDEKANPLLERRLVLLVGGTGTGKSAALRKLVERRTQRKCAAMATNHQMIPAIYFEAEAPDKGQFLFSSLYSAGLRQMNAALVSRTIPLVDRPVGQKQRVTIGVEYAGKRLNSEALKDRFIENLSERQVELLAIDEAVNIFKVGRARSENDRTEQLKEQADKLKSFVNINTPTTLVLAGAYDFHQLILTSGQNARRGRIVHMEPYTMSPEGLDGFAQALIKLIAHLPIRHALIPEDIATELFVQCLGCIGILKTILNEALLLALNTKRSLGLTVIRQTYYTAAQLNVMRCEMEIGIKNVREIMTTAKLAVHAETVASRLPLPKSRPNRLAPGEMIPSHRHDATDGWQE